MHRASRSVTSTSRCVASVVSRRGVPGEPAGDAARGAAQDAGSEARRGRRRGDLTGRPFPLGDWGEPAERLDELYRWVEAGRCARRSGTSRTGCGSGAARGCCGSGRRLGAVAGAALPLLDLTGALAGAAAWGYLSLLLAAACLAVRPVLRADLGLDKGRGDGAGGAAPAAGAAVRLGVGERTGGAGPDGGHGERGGGAVPGGAAAVLGGRDGAGAVGDGGLDGGVPRAGRRRW